MSERWDRKKGSMRGLSRDMEEREETYEVDEEVGCRRNKARGWQ